MPFPTLRLRPDDALSAYLQIKHQVAFAIHNGELMPGDRLPPIRAVAAELGVNAATVAQAYAELQHEGLIEATPGRGSFVRREQSAAESADLITRRRLLDEAVRTALARAAALGFEPTDVREHVAAYVGQFTSVTTVVLVSVTRRTAMRYAAQLEERLHGRIRVVPLGAEDLGRADGHARRQFETAYDALVFGPNVPAVHAFLERTGVAARQIVLTTQVTSGTVRALGGLACGERVRVLTHERYSNVTERLVREHGGSAEGEVEVVVADRLDDLRPAIAGADVVVYNSALHERLGPLLLPPQRAVEVVFELSSESVARLAQRYAAPSTSS